MFAPLEIQPRQVEITKTLTEHLLYAFYTPGPMPRALHVLFILNPAIICD